MTPFEHIMITGAIVLGLAIAQLLMGFADSLSIGRRANLYWPHTLWSLTVLIACFQWGFGAWIYESRSSFLGYELLLFISTPVLVFLVARFMYPSPIDGVPLKQYYYESRSYTYGVTTAVIVLSWIGNLQTVGTALTTSVNMIHLTAVIMLLTLAISRVELVHKILVPLLFMVQLLSLLFLRVGEMV